MNAQLLLALAQGGFPPQQQAGFGFSQQPPQHPEYVTVEDVTDEQHGMQSQQARVRHVPVVEEPDDGRCTTWCDQACKYTDLLLRYEM